MSGDSLGRGLDFPFRFDPRTGAVTLSEEEAHIRASIRQILGTRIGERLMRPEFGSRIHELVFEPNDQVLKSLVRHYVIEALERWEKRIRMLKVEVEVPSLPTDQNLVLVRICFNLKRSQVNYSLDYLFFQG